MLAPEKGDCLESKQPRRTNNTERQGNVGTAESVSGMLSQQISLGIMMNK